MKLVLPAAMRFNAGRPWGVEAEDTAEQEEEERGVSDPHRRHRGASVQERAVDVERGRAERRWWWWQRKVVTPIMAIAAMDTLCSWSADCRGGAGVSFPHSYWWLMLSRSSLARAPGAAGRQAS
jgi:hypothetical protein